MEGYGRIFRLPLAAAPTLGNPGLGGERNGLSERGRHDYVSHIKCV
jgi:hypothetical protein